MAQVSDFDVETVIVPPSGMASDEFLRILIRIKSEDRNIELSMLNPLLEHKKRVFGSGNCNIEASMTARMIAVSNPVYGTSTMTMLCANIDTSFLSRLFIWYLDKEHIKNIQNQSYIQENYYQMDENLFLSILDYLQSFQSTFDVQKVRQIVKGAADLIEQQNYASDELGLVRDVYDARYLHHAYCIIDGIIKTRCICEKDDAFIMKDEDLQLFEKIWLIMLAGWGIYTPE